MYEEMASLNNENSCRCSLLSFKLTTIIGASDVGEERRLPPLP
ncbi:unnamed protein product [Penicillium camemberti]|uniref:Str. FM013 n=1 Tax=Penicillium camemberti (strain FM 013) TaxID=1429867 RepID=A0A0G4PMG8_PENC3|nr:unnamed protein product [Penicillium camemberti]